MSEPKKRKRERPTRKNMEVPVPLALVALEERFFIEELKAARLRVPLTKAQMARRAVVSPSQVGQVEEGVNRFSHNHAIRMSRAAWTRTSTLSRRHLSLAAPASGERSVRDGDGR